MDLQEIKKLLEKYRQNTCTQEERTLIEAWLDPARTPDMLTNEEALEEKLRQIKLKIDLQHAPQPHRVIPMKRWTSAAAILLLLGTGATLWFRHATRQPAPIHTIAQQTIVRQINNGWVTLSTSKGVTHTITLPDSSVVIMNANSRLRYPLAFKDDKRPVYLEEGEAFFTIASDKTKPFTVYTPHFATTALGTAFNIKAYSRERKVAISLIQGKVRVDNLQAGTGKASHILTPHEQLVLDKVSSQVNNTHFSEAVSITGWQQGMILLDNASKADVINSIENKFAVTIEDRTGNTSWSYTGSFKKESLEEVLQTICMTEGIRFSISDQNKHVVLY